MSNLDKDFNVWLFGGPNDGSILTEVHPSESKFSVPYLRKGGPPTTYIENDQWSQHFYRRTAIPAGFPGLPPKETQAA